MKAYVFPGQGAQFPGMGKNLYDNHKRAKELFKRANDILGFNITEIMFNGTEDDLKQTKVTQPAVFLHSVVAAETLDDFNPDVVAGHSLGEFSALTANKTLSFDDGLKLVYKRALAMQKACEVEPSTMAAILGLDDKIVEKACQDIDEVVVAANYNCPGQIVISGSVDGVNRACEKLKELGAKRALPLKVGGAFHSPLMEPAKIELADAINSTMFHAGICPIYQNVTAQSVREGEIIKMNLIKQLTAPVRWTQIMQNMVNDNVKEVVEVGPGNVLQGLFKKVSTTVLTSGVM